MTLTAITYCAFKEKYTKHKKVLSSVAALETLAMCTLLAVGILGALNVLSLSPAASYALIGLTAVDTLALLATLRYIHQRKSKFTWDRI